MRMTIEEMIKDLKQLVYFKEDYVSISDDPYRDLAKVIISCIKDGATYDEIIQFIGRILCAPPSLN